MTKDNRKLQDLGSIGKAMLEDFSVLGINSVAELSKKDPDKLYKKLCELTGVRHDVCVLDTFHCAVAQAKNPDLSKKQRQWWYYSQLRKSKAK